MLTLGDSVGKSVNRTRRNRATDTRGAGGGDYNLAKVGVEGSNPFARSNNVNDLVSWFRKERGL